MKFLADWKEDCYGTCGNFVQSNPEEVFEVEGDSLAEAEAAALEVATAKINKKREKAINIFIPVITMLVDEDGRVYEKVKAGKDEAGKDKLAWQIKKE